MGAARQQGARGPAVAGAAFAAGLAVGAAAVFGGLGLLGAAISGRPVVVAAVAIAGAAVVSDAVGLRVRPQVRFQVPERWRRTMPLPRALFLYGAMLGAGLTTYVPATAAWALPALSLALGDVSASLAIAGGFAAGRALPVLVLALRGDEKTLAERPHGLRVLRVLTAASLLLVLVAGEARAATTIARPGGDPSAAGADVAWEQPGVGGFVLRAGVKTRLPGDNPAVGGALVAWHVGPTVTLADRDTFAAVVAETLPGVQQLAVSNRWLVYRAGPEIRVQALTDTTRSALVVRAKPRDALGRPSLDGDIVTYHYATRSGSWLTTVNLATGKRRRVRIDNEALLLNPSLRAGSLLYVRASRCAQELVLGRLGVGRERVLYKLPPLAGQDQGHEAHHTTQGEHLPCPHRPKPTKRILWTTALSDTTAYVTVLQPRRGGGTTPTLLALGR